VTGKIINIWVALLGMIFIFVIFGLIGCGEKREKETYPEIQEQVMKKSTETNKPSIIEQKNKELNIPKLLQQDHKGIIQFLGKPTGDEIKNSDVRILKYTLAGFELEIRLFMDTPVSMDITPLEDYSFTNSAGYAISDVPDDVMRLLRDLGFDEGSVTGGGDSPAQRLFLYMDYGTPLREYEIRVNNDDWRAVNEGKTSNVSWVYVKLINTK